MIMRLWQTAVREGDRDIGQIDLSVLVDENKVVKNIQDRRSREELEVSTQIRNCNGLLKAKFQGKLSMLPWVAGGQRNRHSGYSHFEFV